MAMAVTRRKVCGAPLPPSTAWIGDGRGCRLDYEHDGAHLIEVRRLETSDMHDRFTYRARFGGL